MSGRTCIHGTSLQWFCMDCGGTKRTVADGGTGLGDELAALTDENKRLKHLLHVAEIDLKDSQERVQRRSDDLSAMHDYGAALRSRLELADKLATAIDVYRNGGGQHEDISKHDPTLYRWTDVLSALAAYDAARKPGAEGG